MPRDAAVRHSAAYLRHGCALALALGCSDDATQAVIGLLLVEPTEPWQEIARARSAPGAGLADAPRGPA